MKDYSRVIMMFSLPRSRTQWWRWFFSHGMTAWHDPLARHAAIPSFVREVDAWLAANKGPLFIADTSAIFFHERICQSMPGLRKLYMFRNRLDVIASLRRQTGLDFTDLIEQQNTKLWRHGRGQDLAALRLHWGLINATLLGTVWRMYVNPQPPTYNTLRDWSRHHVDVPVLQQPHDAEKRQSLMGYIEK